MIFKELILSRCEGSREYVMNDETGESENGEELTYTE